MYVISLFLAFLITISKENYYILGQISTSKIDPQLFPCWKLTPFGVTFQQARQFSTIGWCYFLTNFSWKMTWGVIFQRGSISTLKVIGCVSHLLKSAFPLRAHFKCVLNVVSSVTRFCVQYRMRRSFWDPVSCCTGSLIRNRTQNRVPHDTLVSKRLGYKGVYMVSIIKRAPFRRFRKCSRDNQQKSIFFILKLLF